MYQTSSLQLSSGELTIYCFKCNWSDWLKRAKYVLRATFVPTTLSIWKVLTHGKNLPQLKMIIIILMKLKPLIARCTKSAFIVTKKGFFSLSLSCTARLESLTLHWQTGHCLVWCYTSLASDWPMSSGSVLPLVTDISIECSQRRQSAAASVWAHNGSALSIISRPVRRRADRTDITLNAPNTCTFLEAEL